jgi:hypothetical protein
MRYWSAAPLAAAALAAMGVSGGAAAADQGMRISGPHVHANLAIYLVHGASAPGPVPLTLQEAVAKGHVQVIETGRVNELQIENTGNEAVFVQAGDIVKGGKQDRVLTVSFLLPANSGRLPIASFCVEQGRWAARGKEELGKFSSAGEAMPSRTALLAMAAPPPEAKTDPAGPSAASPPDAARAASAQRIAREQDQVAKKQREVWDSVAATQNKLARGLNAPVAAPESASSLQLALENAKLKEARAGYVQALLATGEAEGDVVGYVVAINGKMSAANLYPSNGLFRKMWSKQLAAVVTEAIGEQQGAGNAASPPPAPSAATEFLAEAEKGKSYERPLAAGTRQETRDADKSLYNEARAADGKWIHRSYLAK